MWVVGGHDDALTGVEFVFLIVDGDDARTVERCDERVSLGFMRADSFALGEGKECDAETFILDERLADNLSVCIGDLILEREHLCVCNIV